MTQPVTGGINPFKSQPDWHNNAIINNYMQFAELGECYLASANSLIECVDADRYTLDVHIYSICFLYRHACELFLKDLFWKSNYAVRGSKDFPRHHRLIELWQGVCSHARTLLGKDFPLESERVAQVEELLRRFEEHDPGSDAFRYPIDRRKQRTHSSLTNVNIRSLRDAMSKINDHFGRLAWMVEYHCEQRSNQSEN